MIRAHQPGSQPIDIPEAIPNPAVPQPAPIPSPAPKEPVKAPAGQNAAIAWLVHSASTNSQRSSQIAAHSGVDVVRYAFT